VRVELGRRLRELRQRKALSLYQVAARLGVHFSTIGKYERGVRRPDIETLRRLAAVYEVDVAELIGDQAPGSPTAQAARLNRRPDLGVLVDVAERLSPQEVLVLTDLLRMLTERVGRGVPAAAEGAPPWGGEAGDRAAAPGATRLVRRRTGRTDAPSAVLPPGSVPRRRQGPAPTA